MAHENTRRESIEGSTTHHESPYPSPLSVGESSICENEVDEEENIQEVQRSCRSRGRARVRTRGRGGGIALARFKWSHEQDTHLCRSWLTISNDGITGNDQTYGDLSARIVQYLQRLEERRSRSRY